MKLAPRHVLLALSCALVFSFASSAFADQKDYADQKDADGYRVVFKDDPMTASRDEASGSLISVRPRAARMSLLKPRTQFVGEMLKSVENL